MGTATVEAKLAQQLAFLEQEALFKTFANLKQAYDAMDHKRCLEILKKYEVGPMMLRLIKYFWDHANSVCHAVGSYDAPFKAHYGAIHGGPLLPQIFNVMVDAVLRGWLCQVLGVDDARHGYGKGVRKFFAICYADDGLVAGYV